MTKKKQTESVFSESDLHPPDLKSAQAIARRWNKLISGEPKEPKKSKKQQPKKVEKKEVEVPPEIESEEFPCPYTNCPRHGNPFKLESTLKRHITMKHGGVYPNE